jgi:hypothetical protein
MAVKVVHVSDISDKEGSQDKLGTLEVLEHPEIGEPAHLEVFPDEFERLQAADQVVQLRWTAPGVRQPQELTVLQETFDSLAQDRDMKTVLLSAITAQHERRGQTQAPRRHTAAAQAAARSTTPALSTPASHTRTHCRCREGPMCASTWMQSTLLSGQLGGVRSTPTMERCAAATITRRGSRWAATDRRGNQHDRWRIVTDHGLAPPRAPALTCAFC